MPDGFVTVLFLSRRLQTFAMESKLTSFVAWRSDSVSQAFPTHPVGLRYR